LMFWYAFDSVCTAGYLLRSRSFPNFSSNILP